MFNAALSVALQDVIVGSTCRDGQNDAGATCGFAYLGGSPIL